MVNSWYVGVFKNLEKYIKLKIPFEIIHFPSAGLTSAIRKAAEYLKKKHIHPVVIDFRAGLFSAHTENKAEFYRIVKSHCEQTFNNELEETKDNNLFKNLEKTFYKINKEGDDVLLILETNAKVNPYILSELKDFLIFIDKLRDHTDGKINIIILTTQQLFNDRFPAPIPMISQYYNYYRAEDEFWNFNNTIFKINYPQEIKSQLFKKAGGMGALIKYINRDLEFYCLKPEAFIERKINHQFFADFMNLKIRLDRIKSQLTPEIIEVIGKIAHNHPLNNEDAQIRDVYLTKTGFLDETKSIRGEILVEYFRLYSGISSTLSESEEGLLNQEANALLKINDSLNIHSVSGQVWKDNQNYSILTEKELQIVKILFQNRGKEISREQIAKIIWKAEEYSDWALDKLISRIRKKLKDARPHSIIRTNRKNGFTLW